MKKFILVSVSIILVSCDGGLSSLFPKLLMSSSSLSAKVGTSVNIEWIGENIRNCNASGAWSGDKNLSGSENIIIEKAGSNQFSISCQDLSGLSLIHI